MCLAIPGKVIEVMGTTIPQKKARVSFGGAIKEISLAFTPEAQVGDYVLVHVGFAISTIDEEKAKQQLAYMKEIGADDEIH